MNTQQVLILTDGEKNYLQLTVDGEQKCFEATPEVLEHYGLPKDILIDNESDMSNVTISEVEGSLSPSPDIQLIEPIALTENLTTNKENSDLARWSHNAIKCLISEYKIHYGGFKDSKTNKNSIWEDISNNLTLENYTYTAQQCKVKFSALKHKYTKTRDHNGKTGNDPMHFKYEIEFDDIFSKDHFITPSHIAESSTYNSPENESSLDNNDSELDDNVCRPHSRVIKRKRMSNSQIMLQEIKKMNNNLLLERQDAEERFKKKMEMKKEQHKEVLDSIKHSTDVFKETMISLINKF